MTRQHPHLQQQPGSIHISRRFLIRLTFITIILFTACSPPKVVIRHALSDGKSLQLSNEAFNHRLTLAQELVLDDQLAWVTSDTLSTLDTLLLDSMDQTWFVVCDNKYRSVFYGRYDTVTERYLPKYAFTAHGNGEPERNSLEITEPIHTYARAVATGTSCFNMILDSLGFAVSYNHYIRQNNDSTFTMWFFPAGYNNYCAQGLDIVLSLHPDGKRVEHRSVHGKFIRYFELTTPEQAIRIDNHFDTLPSVGNLFFTLNNREHFKKFLIVCASATYSYFFDAADDRWIWNVGDNDTTSTDSIENNHP